MKLYNIFTILTIGAAVTFATPSHGLVISGVKATYKISKSFKKSSKVVRSNQRRSKIGRTSSAKRTSRTASAKEINQYKNARIKKDGIQKKTSAKAVDTARRRPPNWQYKGSTHPKTKVPFNKKGFAQFDKWSKFDCNMGLGKVKIGNNRAAHNKICNEQLFDTIVKDPILKKQFSPFQLKQLKGGKTPIGNTWHHTEFKNQMQLVPTKIHGGTGHIGGYAKYY